MKSLKNLSISRAFGETLTHISPVSMVLVLSGPTALPETAALKSALKTALNITSMHLGIANRKLNARTLVQCLATEVVRGQVGLKSACI